MTEHEKDLIRQAFSTTGNIVNASFRFVMRNNPHLVTVIDNELKLFPEYQSPIKLVKCVVNGLCLTKCLNCGKLLSYDKSFHLKNRYCSLGCAHSSDELKEKKKKTFLRNYGVEFGLQSPEIRKRVERTNIKRYGVRTPASLDKIKKRARETCMDRYGAGNPMGNASVRDKARKTCLERYGVDVASKSELVKKRAEKTCVSRYGVKSTAMLESVKDKARATNNQRHGVDWVQQNKDIGQKRKNTNLERYGNEVYLRSDVGVEKARNSLIDRHGVDSAFLIPGVIEKRRKANQQITAEKRRNRYNILSSGSVIAPLFSVDDYIAGDSERAYRWECVNCGNQFEQRLYTTGLGADRRMPRCLICHPVSSGLSILEKDLVCFIKSFYSGEVIENSKKITPPLELDIYLPEKKLAIEFDGLFWHNDKNKDGCYHLNKTEQCEKQGIQLIHIFEDEWMEKQEIVKSRIRSLLNNFDQVIYARKCHIGELDSKTSNEFLEHNHLQGRDNASIRYGLYSDNELVSVMTFGKSRFNKNYDFEMIRFCSKLDTQVIGGAGRLLKCFQRNHTGSIVSYADRRYSVGKMYQSLGFKLLSASTPNYWWTKAGVKLSRYQCKKHKLKELLGNRFNSELTESENMMLNGYNKIYDCGNLVFVKT